MSFTPEQARELWVKALRSGEYKRTSARLHRVIGGVDRYCCLGVACDLYRQEVGEGEWTKTNSDWLRFEVPNAAPSEAFLPAVVREWLGLASSSGDLKEIVRLPNPVNDRAESLTSLNDRGGQNFDQIADQIANGNVKLAPEESDPAQP